MGPAVPVMSTASRLSALVCALAAALPATGCTHSSAYRLESSAEPQAPSPTPLTPNEHGYVRVESVAGDIGCSIITDVVACQRLSGTWQSSGGLGHTASVSADGKFQWVDADLGELKGRIRLQTGSFTAQGWTIVAGPAETRFVNDHGGHGMTCNDHTASAF